MNKELILPIPCGKFLNYDAERVNSNPSVAQFQMPHQVRKEKAQTPTTVILPPTQYTGHLSILVSTLATENIDALSV